MLFLTTALQEVGKQSMSRLKKVSVALILNNFTMHLRCLTLITVDML